MIERISTTIKGWNWTLADWSLAWILFFSVVQQRWSPIGFGIWIILALKKARWSEWRTLLKKMFSGMSGILIAYFLWLSIGVIWSDQNALAIGKLENKLSFILFPLLFHLSVLKMSVKQWKFVFIAGLACVLLLNEVLAGMKCVDASSGNWIEFFSGSVFSPFMHRSYLACYLCLGLVLLSDLKTNENKKWVLILMILFSIGVIQTLSKIGIIIWVMLLGMYVFGEVKMASKKKQLSALAAVIGGMAMIGSVMGESIYERFNNIGQSMSEMQLYNNSTVESNAARLIMWNTSLELVKENWFWGYGTGDADLVLKTRNVALGNAGVAEEGLNSHNQFLTSWLQLGCVGIMILIFLFIQAWRRSGNRWVESAIVTIFFLNLLVESFLETQSGVVLFGVFMVLMFDFKNQEGQSSVV